MALGASISVGFFAPSATPYWICVLKRFTCTECSVRWWKWFHVINKAVASLGCIEYPRIYPQLKYTPQRRAPPKLHPSPPLPSLGQDVTWGEHVGLVETRFRVLGSRCDPIFSSRCSCTENSCHSRHAPKSIELLPKRNWGKCQEGTERGYGRLQLVGRRWGLNPEPLVRSGVRNAPTTRRPWGSAPHLTRSPRDTV